MAIEQRIRRLEEGQPAGDDGEAPPIIVVWPEDETPESRAAYRAAVAWHVKHKSWPPADVRVVWNDGSEAGAP